MLFGFAVTLHQSSSLSGLEGSMVLCRPSALTTAIVRRLADFSLWRPAICIAFVTKMALLASVVIDERS
jgi:hypothetical protein